MIVNTEVPKQAATAMANPGAAAPPVPTVNPLVAIIAAMQNTPAPSDLPAKISSFFLIINHAFYSASHFALAA